MLFDFTDFKISALSSNKKGSAWLEINKWHKAQQQKIFNIFARYPEICICKDRPLRKGWSRVAAKNQSPLRQQS